MRSAPGVSPSALGGRTRRNTLTRSVWMVECGWGEGVEAAGGAKVGQQLRQGSSTYMGAAWVLRCCTAVAPGCAAKACDYCMFTAATTAAAAHHRGGRPRRGAAWPKCQRCSGGGRRPWWGCPTGRRPASSGPPWPPTCRRLAGLRLPAAAGPTAATAPAVGLLHWVQHGGWGTRTARWGMFSGRSGPNQPTQFCAAAS